MGVIASPNWHEIAPGHTDYLSFYSGGRLVFTPHLYDPDYAMAEQLRAAGVMGKGTYYTRMPWFAAAMWPLARLPFLTGHWIWESLLLCGLIAFVALWPRPSFGARATILCYSMPALICLRMGQDPPLLAALMAISLLLLNRGKPIVAGLVLSLTLAKFHLFLPLFPAVILARRWKFAAGLYGGAAFLLAMNFVVDGPGWPMRYFAAITNPTVTPGVIITPSLYYLIPGAPVVHSVVVGVLAIAMMVTYLWLARKDVELLIAAAPVTILPLLPHAGSYDCLLLAPLAFYALDKGSREAKIAAVALLIPVTYLIAWSISWCAIIVPILAMALLAFCAIPARDAEPAEIAGHQIISTG